MITLPARLRKLIGLVLLLVLIVTYALAAVTVATYRLAEASAVVHFTFFLVSGLLWVLPAMLLIKWMAGPVKKKA
ncbi:MAG: DUF2842 domain-containing protein [Rhizobiaceae bacterium]